MTGNPPQATAQTQAGINAAPAHGPYHVPATEVAVTPTIYISQVPYNLSEVEYDRIKRGRPVAAAVFFNLFMAASGASYEVLAKGFGNVFAGRQVMAGLDRTQAIVVAVGLGVAGIAWLVAYYLPSDYSRTMFDIKDHFKKFRPVRHFGDPK